VACRLRHRNHRGRTQHRAGRGPRAADDDVLGMSEGARGPYRPHRHCMPVAPGGSHHL